VTAPAAGTRDWDAASYDALPLPHLEWGRRTLARLPLSGGETVLELGCGTGRDTAKLLARLPRGRVIALDGSPAMIERTLANCGGDPRLRTVHHDLREPLPLPDASVDAVFSVATLHWLPDHAAVFAELARVMRPGARLALDYGGAGNTPEVLAALRDLGRGAPEWTYGTAESERAALAAVGFDELDVRLSAQPPFRVGAHLERFLTTVILGHQLAGMPPDERPAFVAAVAERLPRGEVCYVRLEAAACRAVVTTVNRT
jgi:trans-aconitate 2-methyltransferase